MIPDGAPAGTEVLSIRDLTVVHAGRGAGLFRRAVPIVAVRGASIEVRSGEMVGIVGESGSGKSTMALVASGFVRPTSGETRLCGMDLFRLRGAALRRARVRCQLIFQDPVGSLDPRQTISAAFREIRRLHPDLTSWTTDEALVESVELSPALLGRYPHQLSGGQAQRIAIARAILVRPAILIADEATSALDVSVQAQILALLKSLRQAHGIAILLISHDLAVVRQTCDRVYVAHQGEIVEHGPTEQVLASPRHDYTKHLIEAVVRKGRRFTERIRLRSEASAI